MDPDVILDAAGLSKEFRGFYALQDVRLEVRRGTIHALIGPNGAGKTTCFNLLTKFLAPTHGAIVFNGKDITALKPAEVARLGMVRSFQISAVFPHLSVLENVRIALQRARGNSFDFWRSHKALDAFNDRAMALLDNVGLTGFATESAIELPYGRKRALEIATTLALDPQMLLLDEPTAGMGQEDIARTAALIKRVAADRTVLMVEHNLSVVPLGRHHRPGPGPGAGRRRLCGGIQKPAGDRGVHGFGTWLSLSLRRRPCRSPPAPRCWKCGTCTRGTANRTSCTGSTRRRSGDAARPQRRRQDDDVEVDHGDGQQADRLNRLRRSEDDRPRQQPDRPVGHRHLSRGARYLRQPERGGEFPSAAARTAGGLSDSDILELFPNLRERFASRGTHLSGGEQQMLAIGRILRTGAQLLLLDEPTEGLAPIIVQHIGGTPRTLKEQGFTILLVEQNFRFASTVADRYYVVEHGRVIDTISNDDLAAEMPKVQAYLGV